MRENTKGEGGQRAEYEYDDEGERTKQEMIRVLNIMHLAPCVSEDRNADPGLCRVPRVTFDNRSFLSFI